MLQPALIATLPYLAPVDGKPVYYASSAGVEDGHNTGVVLDFREVAIYNARTAEITPSLDREGFTLVDHKSVITDFYALGSQQPNYEREIRALVLSATGGTEAVVFDHTLRSDCAAIRTQKNTRDPAGFVHNDYTARSAHKRVRDSLPVTEAAKRLEQRFAIINVWRSVEGSVLRSPMTCCDATTLSEEDLVAVERRAKDRAGELEFATWNSRHRWYYYPDMSMGEALLIKTFDSASDGRATRSIHTAFKNPLARADAPPRESIESRLLVFFD